MPMRFLRRFVAVMLLPVCVAVPGLAAAQDADDDLPNLAIPLDVSDPVGSFGFASGDLEATGGVADADWIRLLLGANRSYEVIISVRNLLSGGFNTLNASLQRYNSTGATLLQNSQTAWFDTLRTLQWRSTEDGVQLLRVLGTNTMTAFDSSYSLSMRESTLFCPRYNNSGTQLSVLIMQNTSDLPCDFSAHFFNEAGTLVGTGTGTYPVSGTAVVAGASVAGVSGTRGSVRIAHTCGLGGVAAKAVAVEPATGFTFDTVCTSR